MKQIILCSLIIGVLVFVGFQLIYTEQVNIASVSQGSGYNATSTAGGAVYGAFTGDQLLKTGWGTLGSVVITGANTGIVNFYNATTSNVLARTKNIASSTILMASMPASLVAGTYVFDTVFTSGLLVELESGIMPTTTITWR